MSGLSLDLVSKERQWLTNSHGSESEENYNKLELTLGPPGAAQKWSSQRHEHDDSALLSLAHHSSTKQQPSWPNSSAKFLHFSANDASASAGFEKESPLHKCTSTKMAELQTRTNNDAATAANTAVPQKRTAPGPVVGWPPLRSFRKNLASSSTSTKPSPEAEPQNEKLNLGKKGTEAAPSPAAKGLFVKINMDGIPIGRKVDLNAYDSYEKLSSAVDKLFRGLLAAQTDSFANGIPSNLEAGKPITGLLDGSGEYTLVYEDNEGDRVLVGDVPWRMFVSTVKRLRVLKTSELPSLSLGGKQQKMQPR